MHDLCLLTNAVHKPKLHLKYQLCANVLPNTRQKQFLQYCSSLTQQNYPVALLGDPSGSISISDANNPTSCISPAVQCHTDCGKSNLLNTTSLKSRTSSSACHICSAPQKQLLLSADSTQFPLIRTGASQKNGLAALSLHHLPLKARIACTATCRFLSCLHWSLLSYVTEF